MKTLEQKEKKEHTQKKRIVNLVFVFNKAKSSETMNKMNIVCFFVLTFHGNG